MRKNIIYTVLFSLTIMMGLSSCDLNQEPEGELSVNESWKTISDAKQYQSGLYAALRGIYGSYYTYATEIQSDLFNASASYGNTGGSLHRWTFMSDDDDTPDIWAGNYSVITNCNNIINNIDNIALTSASDSTDRNEIKGEAYLIRALCYHNLVIRFAKNYDPSTADKTVGLPIVTTVDINAKPARSSLKDTYSFIKQDIANAESLMTNDDHTNVYTLSLSAATLLEARVDLYMQDFKGADQLAQKIITDGGYPLITDPAKFADMWLNDTGSEIIFEPYSSTDELPNGMGVFLNYSTSAQGFSPSWIPSKWVYDLYDPSDIRKGIFFTKQHINCGAQHEADDVYMLNKFPGNPALKKDPSEYSYYNMIKVFRSAEAYLISAEARYKDGDEAGAKEVLNELRTARGETPSASSGDQLFEDIKNEWLKEFIGEGYRLDCLKRWGDGFTRHDPQNTNVLTISDPSTYINLTIKADDKRFVWEIPSNDRESDPQITPNW